MIVRKDLRVLYITTLYYITLPNFFYLKPVSDIKQKKKMKFSTNIPK